MSRNGKKQKIFHGLTVIHMKTFYAGCCGLGIALPFWQLVPWLVENGFDLTLLVKEAA